MQLLCFVHKQLIKFTLQLILTQAFQAEFKQMTRKSHRQDNVGLKQDMAKHHLQEICPLTPNYTNTP